MDAIPVVVDFTEDSRPELSNEPPRESVRFSVGISELVSETPGTLDTEKSAEGMGDPPTVLPPLSFTTGVK